jgi:hypothetical protein
MAEVRYEVLVGYGIGDMKTTLSFTNLDDAVDFYDDLCKLINRYVSNHEGSVFRGVFLLEEHDKSKVVKGHYYCNNNGRLSDKEIKYYL